MQKNLVSHKFYFLALYFPDKEKGFYSTFLLQVIGGKKKVSLYSSIIGGVFHLDGRPRGSITNILERGKITQNYIIEKMMKNANYGDYIPDKILASFSCDFLLCVSNITKQGVNTGGVFEQAEINGNNIQNINNNHIIKNDGQIQRKNDNRAIKINLDNNHENEGNKIFKKSINIIN